MIWLLLLQLAQWQPVTPPTLHQGFWQTCNGEERVLEHRVSGRFQWELHLGPQDEFAIYDHHVDHNKIDDDSHASPDNLLGPAFRVYDVQTLRGARQWNIPKLGLWVSIVAAGSADGPCMSFYIKVARLVQAR